MTSAKPAPAEVIAAPPSAAQYPRFCAALHARSLR